MNTTLFDSTRRVGDHDRVDLTSVRARTNRLSLFWRVFVLNGLVFATGTVVLALSPATVSSPVLPTEFIVLAVGLVVMLAVNALLLRMGLAPLGRLMRLMETIDLLRPGQRLPERGSGEVTLLVRTFNAMLTRLETERATSSAQALSAQESERRRISRELHDEIGQSLTVVLLGLKRAVDQAPDALRPDLVQTQETARDSLDNVRQIARRLRPDLLEELGLMSALTALVNEFSELTGVRVERAFDHELPVLTEEAEVVVYRIAQESLTNIARHAHARRVDMNLTHDDLALRLSVSDDGQGIGQLEGAGIRGMRERALLVDALLNIDSEPGRGTTVSLTVPRTGQTEQR